MRKSALAPKYMYIGLKNVIAITLANVDAIKIKEIQQYTLYNYQNNHC